MLTVSVDIVTLAAVPLVGEAFFSMEIKVFGWKPVFSKYGNYTFTPSPNTIDYVICGDAKE